MQWSPGELTIRPRDNVVHKLGVVIPHGCCKLAKCEMGVKVAMVESRGLVDGGGGGDGGEGRGGGPLVCGLWGRGCKQSSFS